MRRADVKTPDVIRRAVSHARTPVGNARILLSDGFWKARKPLEKAGPTGTDPAPKIEDGA